MKKRITILEIIIIVAVLSVFALFLSPGFMNSKEQLQQATVRANVAIGVSAITSVFSIKKTTDAPVTPVTKVAYLISETLNKSTKNPLTQKNPAFTVNTPTKGAIDFVADDSNDFIIINGYAEDIKNPILSQTVRKDK